MPSKNKNANDKEKCLQLDGGAFYNVIFKRRAKNE